MSWQDLKVDVPSGTLNKWKVERFTVTPEQETIQKLRAACNPQRPDRTCPAGEYTALIHKDRGIIMSDTRAELEDQLDLMIKGSGEHCLVFGLGLGATVNGLLVYGAKSVTVYELDPDVAQLVAPHWLARWGDKIDIRLGDANKITPEDVPSEVEVVWIDIWDTIDMGNLPQMEDLMERWRLSGRWCQCWSYPDALRQQERIETGTGLY